MGRSNWPDYRQWKAWTPSSSILQVSPLHISNGLLQVKVVHSSAWWTILIPQSLSWKMCRCTISLAVFPESDTGSLTNPAMKCASQLETLGQGWRFKSGAEMAPQVDCMPNSLVKHFTGTVIVLRWRLQVTMLEHQQNILWHPKLWSRTPFFFCQHWKTELEAVYFPTLPNIQEDSTTDIPLPRFARYRKNAVYENCAGGVGVLRPSPEGSGFGVWLTAYPFVHS